MSAALGTAHAFQALMIALAAHTLPLPALAQDAPTPPRIEVPAPAPPTVAAPAPAAAPSPPAAPASPAVPTPEMIPTPASPPAVPRMEETAPAPPRALTKKVRPAYPDEARRQGLNGSVLMELVVDAQGAVSQAKVVESSDPIFEASSLEAVKHWRFEATPDDGSAADITLQVPISFALN